ncbi:protein transport protein Sec24C [Clarias gariepinus]|uniref:protein transport protein Sec24C n=1 Tax=Clarias gariepinus TaxID=13013 RepID=UPI00234C35D8|nr:protein transport protein Sec24C [Clarias gariepinus]XP_053336462.1 protein transport protein Sec24C [Clarias gariepinus]
MEFPGSDPGFVHQQPTWEAWNGWAGNRSPACTADAFLTPFPGSGYHLQPNGAPQNGPTPSSPPGYHLHLNGAPQNGPTPSSPPGYHLHLNGAPQNGPTPSSPPGYHLHLNGAPQNGPPPSSPSGYHLHPNSVSPMGPSVMPGSAVTSGLDSYWSPPQPHCNGVYKPLPDTRSPAQMSLQDINSQPTSPVSSPKSESRYGLDPQLLPSVVQVMNEDRAQWEGKIFATEHKSTVPPLSSTSCTLEDRGNATARFIRCTSYNFPIEAQSAQQSHLPLAAILCPLARPENKERSVPVCNAGECVKGCGACGAFMSPAMSWQDCGQRFYCPFCGKLTEVPWQSYQPTNNGQRVDREKRPELSLGSYEILEAQKGEPAVLLLAIDVNAVAIRSGELDFICQQLCTLLLSLSGEKDDAESDLRVGLITYDSRIHLYDLSPTLSRPRMMVLTDTDELELPVHEGLLVPLKDCRHTIESILQQIPLFDVEMQDSSGSQDVSIQAGLKILQAAGCPGKLLVFHSSPLTENSVKQSSLGFFSSSKPKSIFQAPDSSASLAKACVSQGCSVQLFVFSQPDVGGAWPGHVPFLTGGRLTCYNSLQSQLERERFHGDLWRSVETDMAYRAQLRVFVSKELHVSGCYGAVLGGPESHCVVMAALDWHTALAFEFTHSKSLDETRGVAIQAVLSYSGSRGERRTRVHTVSLACSQSLIDTFRTSQAETLLTFYCKKMYCAALDTPLQCLREELQTEITEALACYRKHCCTTSVSPGQLVMPHFLKILPVYINSLRKSEVLLPGLRSSVHQRLQLRSITVSMDTCSTVAQLYPLVLPLLANIDGDSVSSVDAVLRCSSSSLQSDGLYLLYSPLTLILWVGSQVSAQALTQLFNTSSFLSLTSGEMKPPVLDNPMSVSLHKLISTLQSYAAVTLKLKVAKEGDSCDECVQRLLVEDRSPNGGASYADFLFHLHVNSLRRVVG